MSSRCRSARSRPTASSCVGADAGLVIDPGDEAQVVIEAFERARGSARRPSWSRTATSTTSAPSSRWPGTSRSRSTWAPRTPTRWPTAGSALAGFAVEPVKDPSSLEGEQDARPALRAARHPDAGSLARLLHVRHRRPPVRRRPALLRQRRAAPTCRAATWTHCSTRSPTSCAASRPTRRCTAATAPTRRWGASWRSTPSSRRCATTPDIAGERPARPQGHLRPAAGRGRAARPRGRDGGARLRRPRLPAHRHPRVRGDGPLRARRRRGDRHRAQGDVHLRGQGRPLAHPAPRGHGADLPRLRRARPAQVAAAGEALVLLPDVPLRAPAGGALPRALPDRRRGDRLGGAGGRRRGDRHARPAASPSSASSGLRLAVNSMGDAACRPAYVDRLRDYLRDRRGRALRRLPRAPRAQPAAHLRLQGRDLPRACSTRRRTSSTTSAPTAARTSTRVLDLLRRVGLEPQLDFRLVRGLDYYTRTTFEFSSDRLGAQSGVGGGGRYDGLVEQIGGPPTPGVGFGSGLERIALAMGERRGRGRGAGGVRRRLRRRAPRRRLRARRGAAPRRASPSSWTSPGAASRASSSRRAAAARAFAVLVGLEELPADAVRVRALAGGGEEDVPAAGLAAWLARGSPTSRGRRAKDDA